MISLKKTIMGFVGLAMSANAFCQSVEPTTLKDDNLKGNVLAVKFGTYEYKENFGEPVAGNVKGSPVETIYDEQGRSVLRRTLWNGGSVASASYFFKYEDNGAKVKKYVAYGRGDSNKYQPLSDVFSTVSSAYETLMSQGDFYPENNAVYEYDGSILVSYTLNKGKTDAIEGKYVAKKQADGSYKWTYYKGDGSSLDDGVITYNKGIIASMTAASEGGFAKKKAFDIPEPGTYTYDAKGCLIDHVLKAEARKYTYNEKGDMTKMSKKVFKSWSDQYFYENYVYDDHGNWISRTRCSSPGKPNVYEKREIIYADSKEDLAQKSAALVQAVEPVIMKLF